MRACDTGIKRHSSKIKWHPINMSLILRPIDLLAVGLERGLRRIAVHRSRSALSCSLTRSLTRSLAFALAPSPLLPPLPSSFFCPVSSRMLQLCPLSTLSPQVSLQLSLSLFLFISSDVYFLGEVCSHRPFVDEASDQLDRSSPTCRRPGRQASRHLAPGIFARRSGRSSMW
jgi:hypothetical protein